MWIFNEGKYVFVTEIKFGKEIVGDDLPRDVVYCKRLADFHEKYKEFYARSEDYVRNEEFKIIDQDQVNLIKRRLFKEE